MWCKVNSVSFIFCSFYSSRLKRSMWNKWTQFTAGVKTMVGMLTEHKIQHSCTIWTHNLNCTVIIYIVPQHLPSELKMLYDKYACIFIRGTLWWEDIQWITVLSRAGKWRGLAKSMHQKTIWKWWSVLKEENVENS